MREPLHIAILLPFIIAGFTLSIFFSSSISYFTGRSRKDELYLALCAFFSTLYGLFTALDYLSDTIEECIVWQRWQLGTILVVHLFFILFSLTFFQIQRSPLKYFAVSLLLFVPINIIDPFNSLSIETPEFKTQLGLQIYESAIGPAVGISVVYLFLIDFWLFLILVKSRVNKYYILLVILVLVICGNDVFLFSGMYTGEYGLALLVVVGTYMTIGKNNDYRKELENQVSERTQALSEKNQQLLDSNQTLQEKNSELRSRNQEKEVLLKELHHRVKNNLQILIGLLWKPGNFISEETKNILWEAKTRIQSMAQIHTFFYRSSNLSQINFDHFLDAIIQDFLKGNDSMNLKINKSVDLFPMDLDIAMILGLAINEALSNSFKHAFYPGKGKKLALSIRREDGRIEIIIEDDGPGFPQNILQKKGSGCSYGLELMFELIETRLAGKVTLYQSQEGGAGVKMELPEDVCTT